MTRKHGLGLELRHLTAVSKQSFDITPTILAIPGLRTEGKFMQTTLPCSIDHSIESRIGLESSFGQKVVPKAGFSTNGFRNAVTLKEMAVLSLCSMFRHSSLYQSLTASIMSLVFWFASVSPPRISSFGIECRREPCGGLR